MPSSSPYMTILETITSYNITPSPSWPHAIGQKQVLSQSQSTPEKRGTVTEKDSQAFWWPKLCDVEPGVARLIVHHTDEASDGREGSMEARREDADKR